MKSALFFAAMLGSASAYGCGDCWCVRDKVHNETCPPPPKNYSAAEIAKFTGPDAPQPESVRVLDHDCNPYINSSCVTIPPLAPETPDAVCAVKYTNGCKTYSLKDFPNASAAKAAGYEVSHNGACGLCSTLQDLASYMAIPDMTTTGKKCAIASLLNHTNGHQCFLDLGMTPACATIWMWDAIYDAPACGLSCIGHLNESYNLEPDCRLNRCLQCDEDMAGPLFKRYAARTRRVSGLISAIQRPCSTVAKITHQPCN
eukprot:Hpha_TRINITY_DN15440_c2_g2::TRINITY_DN15440_c2_g2_i1::g.174381::m.174381